MPITVDWDNKEKTIIRHTYSGEYTWEEYDAVARRQTDEMLDSVEHKVDIIGDLREAIVPKDALANFRKMVSAAPFTHSNAGLVVMLGPPRMGQIIIDLLGKVYPPVADKMVIVTTEEEAYEIIAEQRRHRLG